MSYETMIWENPERPQVGDWYVVTGAVIASGKTALSTGDLCCVGRVRNSAMGESGWVVSWVGVPDPHDLDPSRYYKHTLWNFMLSKYRLVWRPGPDEIWTYPEEEEQDADT